MKKNILIFLLILLKTLIIYAQIEHFDSTINVVDLKRHVQILASDELEGRQTFQYGQKKAAEYISSFCKKSNLDCLENLRSYYQSFDIQRFNSNNIQLSYDGQTFDNFDEIIYLGKLKSFLVEKDSIVFIGNGNDVYLSDVNCNGKTIILFGESYLEKIIKLNDSLKYNAILFIPDLSQVEYIQDMLLNKEFYKRTCQINRYVSEDFKITNIWHDELLDMIENRVYIFQISPRIGEELLGMSIDTINFFIKKNHIKTYNPFKNINPKLISYNIDIECKTYSTENVIGYIHGDKYPNKCIVLSAHYDHIGKRDSLIFYGADDNASGVAALLEIAEAFSKAHKNGFIPKKSMLFLFTTGEENGLWGSKYYVNSSVFEGFETIANINMDMIGRIDSIHRDKRNYLYVKGDSIISKLLLGYFDNSQLSLNSFQIEPFYLSSNNYDLQNSDHNSFLGKIVSAVTLTSGTHIDYHEPSDTYEKIEFDSLNERVKFIYKIICSILNDS